MMGGAYAEIPVKNMIWGYENEVADRINGGPYF